MNYKEELAKPIIGFVIVAILFLIASAIQATEQY